MSREAAPGIGLAAALSVLLLSTLCLFAPRVLADCPYENDEKTNSPAASAGCLIKTGGGLLLIRHRFSGKLGVPGGLSSGRESARCTAYRETLEETGIEVAVHDLLRIYETGFHLFLCRPVTPLDPLDEYVVPPSGVSEVTSILLLDPAGVPRNEWRFPEQRRDMLSLFESIAPD